MIIGSLRNDFVRHYIKYLLHEVTVIPLENTEIKLLSGNFRLIANEETKIPRWLARILAKNGKVKIKDEESSLELIGRLTYYAFREKERSPLYAVEEDLYFRIKEYLDILENIQTKEKITNALHSFMKVRIPKIIRRSLTTGQEKDLLLWEDVLAKSIKEISEKWIKSLLETKIEDILREF